MTTKVDVVQCLARYESRKDVSDAVTNILNNDPVYQAGQARRKEIIKAKNERIKEIERAALEPWIDEAKRWKHGDKVYFGVSYKSDWFDMEACRLIKGPRIEKGQWCRVYQYQPKVKRLWLCEPGKPASRKNVINQAFSVGDIRHYEISRTELDLRKRK